ncbi:hypothetical protein FHS19_002501 [Paenibacillus rhizosphaerae]|uniref:Uncharacterized protein n=1 Tax=Paenibacillus rhizosphaerae TaxID=297318 RepID=A0A839TSZ6_9BACL|nr:hypothetical protein [Paenibacillus rhizosphaerae]MBB3127847.1 hypothetical protein [Paenibacillus rhizosphaerae]
MSDETKNRIQAEHSSDQGPLWETISRRLSGSELSTLLLQVFREQTKAANASDLLKRYRDNRFVKPAEVSALDLKRLELDVLEIADAHAFEPIQLSPAAPLGSCSVVATVDQNKVISALRGTELVADATNMLALHISDGLKSGELNNRSRHIRLSTTHRHVRAQQFHAPGMVPHFHVFCMVSSGMDQGSYSFEIPSFWEHIRVYRDIFDRLFHSPISVEIQVRQGYADPEGLVRRVAEAGKAESVDVTVSHHAAKPNNAYYQGLQFTLVTEIQGIAYAIGDGGFVDWTQQLIGNKKQRMLISAIGLERLAPHYRR